jgi:lincosamide nucleotidyltransferase A/C/D/E
MRAADVLYVLDLLAAGDITTWVDGGWGVDALLGDETRAHDDLDLVIEHFDADRYRAVMRAAGFAPKAGAPETARNFVLVDADGREVDVHLVDRDVVVTDANGVQVYGPNGLEYEVGSLGGGGTIAGRRVACCTAAFQVRSHTAYEPDADDAHDVLALCERFDISVPEMYERFRT